MSHPARLKSWIIPILTLVFTGCLSSDPATGSASGTSPDKRYRSINEIVQRRLPIRSVTKGWKGNKISWPTERSLYYTVLYYNGAKRLMPQWTILPNGFNIQGTGEEVVVSDKPPRGVNREYRIEVHKKPLGQVKQVER